MANYKDVVKLIKKNGKFHSSQIFYVFGNPKSDKVLLFEKLAIFYQFINNFKDPFRFYSICSAGILSKDCMKHLNMFKNNKLFYFGDLDPEGIWSYLTFIFGNRKFGKNSRKKINIKFLGIAPKDYKNFLDKRNALIKINKDEEVILEFIKELNVKDLSEKTKFLEKGFKLEAEAISITGFDKYFESKIKNL